MLNPDGGMRKNLIICARKSGGISIFAPKPDHTNSCMLADLHAVQSNRVESCLVNMARLIAAVCVACCLFISAYAQLDEIADDFRVAGPPSSVPRPTFLEEFAEHGKPKGIAVEA